MIVRATEFKIRAGKYLEIAKKEETPDADFLYGLLADSGNKGIAANQIKRGEDKR